MTGCRSRDPTEVADRCLDADESDLEYLLREVTALQYYGCTTDVTMCYNVIINLLPSKRANVVP